MELGEEKKERKRGSKSQMEEGESINVRNQRVVLEERRNQRQLLNRKLRSIQRKHNIWRTQRKNKRKARSRETRRLQFKDSSSKEQDITTSKLVHVQKPNEFISMKTSKGFKGNKEKEKNNSMDMQKVESGVIQKEKQSKSSMEIEEKESGVIQKEKQSKSSMEIEEKESGAIWKETQSKSGKEKGEGRNIDLMEGNDNFIVFGTTASI
uniref:Uncharacterized protein n=1 Tax=Oryza rufipogon TaxID=4529 RepID=A0A0E0PSG5_ORYRU